MRTVLSVAVPTSIEKAIAISQQNIKPPCLYFSKNPVPTAQNEKKRMVGANSIMLMPSTVIVVPGTFANTATPSNENAAVMARQYLTTIPFHVGYFGLYSHDIFLLRKTITGRTEKAKHDNNTKIRGFILNASYIIFSKGRAIHNH